MSHRRTLLAAGYTPLDIIRSSDGLVARKAGGTAGNVASILAFLGWNASIAGLIGDDPAGSELVLDFAKSGVDTSLLNRSPGVDTVRLIHDVVPANHYYVFRCAECGQNFPRSRPLTLDAARHALQKVPDPTVYFFDRANPATVMVAEHFRDRRTTVVFELGGNPVGRLVQRAVAASDIIKQSNDLSPAAIRKTDRDRKSVIRILTEGAGGLTVNHGALKPRHLSAFPTVLVDAAGAGDWCTAGFLHQITKTPDPNQADVVDALRFGQALAAANCAVVGARGLMALSPRTVRESADRVRRERRLRRPNRLPRAAVPTSPVGYCPNCLMPISFLR